MSVENELTASQSSSTVAITDSILDSIKKLIGPGTEHNFFDADLIMHINSAFMILCQIGVGPVFPFSISDNTATWHDFIIEDAYFKSIVDYVYMRCKLAFDPPTSSFVLTSYKEQMQELEWRLNVMAETAPWVIGESTQIQEGT